MDDARILAGISKKSLIVSVIFFVCAETGKVDLKSIVPKMNEFTGEFLQHRYPNAINKYLRCFPNISLITT